MINIGNSWDALLKDEFEKEYFLRLWDFVSAEYESGEFAVYPKKEDIFNALRLTDYNDVKAVIIGQDPYHSEGQAHGLSFSVPKGVPAPPSLVNIFKEYRADLGYPKPETADLTPWAKNGILLLNAVLTVRGGAAASHRNKGWEIFTDRIIELINEKSEPVVFLLWGGFAKKKAELITNPEHRVLTAAHPSPLSAYNGFFGCRHFSQASEAVGGIDWKL